MANSTISASPSVASFRLIVILLVIVWAHGGSPSCSAAPLASSINQQRRNGLVTVSFNSSLAESLREVFVPNIHLAELQPPKPEFCNSVHWLGADLGAPLLLECPLHEQEHQKNHQHKQALWLWGDSLFGCLRKQSNGTVIKQFEGMPRNSIGIVHWKEHANGTVSGVKMPKVFIRNSKEGYEALFGPDGLGPNSSKFGKDDFFWLQTCTQLGQLAPHQEIQSQNESKNLVCMALVETNNRSQPLGFQTHSTALFRIEGVCDQPWSPKAWSYNAFTVPGSSGCLQIATAMHVDKARGKLVMMGSDECGGRGALHAVPAIFVMDLREVLHTQPSFASLRRLTAAEDSRLPVGFPFSPPRFVKTINSWLSLGVNSTRMCIWSVPNTSSESFDARSWAGIWTMESCTKLPKHAAGNGYWSYSPQWHPEWDIPADEQGVMTLAFSTAVNNVKFEVLEQDMRVPIPIMGTVQVNLD